MVIGHDHGIKTGHILFVKDRRIIKLQSLYDVGLPEKIVPHPSLGSAVQIVKRPHVVQGVRCR